MLTLFDCDGVLVDSEIIAARVLRRYLEDIHFPIVVTEDDHDRFLGFTLTKVRTTLEQEAGHPLPQDFETALRSRDMIAFERDLMPIAGVREAAEALPGALCVASSGAPEKIRSSLKLTGLFDLFAPHLFSAKDPAVANGKPAPDLFLHAAARMGYDPKDCIVIEDSVAGVRAGVAARMRTIGFIGGSHCGPNHAETLRTAGAVAILSDMWNLPSCVASL